MSVYQKGILFQVAMPVVPSESEQMRRPSGNISQQQQQALQGGASCPQGGKQQGAFAQQGGQQQQQGVFAQQGACIGGEQQGVYATSLQGVSGQQQQQSQGGGGGGYPGCQLQEQHGLSPHGQYRNSYLGPGPGVWVGQHQGVAPSLPQFGGGGGGGGGLLGQSSTLDRQRRGVGQQIQTSDSMYHTCTRRPQSMKKKVVTIRENNDTESEV